MSLRFHLRVTLPLVLVGLSASACASDHLGPQRTDLERNRERWEATRPDRYVYAVERLCFCLMRGPARVTVENDEVVSVLLVDPEEGASPSQAGEGLFPDVDGLFDILEDALERDAHGIEVTYDPATGAPLEFFIDYLENAIDEELGMRVTEPVTPLGEG